MQGREHAGVLSYVIVAAKATRTNSGSYWCLLACITLSL